ncbi:MAG: tripartite tricarboxylate transporter permease [Candidatus Bipolaricaulaceae bacterium]
MGQVILQAIGNFADPLVWAAILGAAVFGSFVGAIPGLTATLAAALLVPFAFFLPPLPAIAAYATVSALAISLGDLPALLMRIPGTPASAAYCNDSYLLTRKGKYARAAGTQLIADAIGGVIGGLALFTLAPLLARVAKSFTSFEFFWFSVLGLSSAAIISTGSALKGVISLLIGLLLGTIGIDVTLGYPRFTFGNPNLLGGISFIPAMCGLFGLSEVFRNVVALARGVPQEVISGHWRYAKGRMADH